MNTRMIKNIFHGSIILFVLFLPQFSSAQWFYSLYLEQEYNTNPFGLPISEYEQISRVSMGLQKDWEKVSVQYFGSYHAYFQNPTRSFYWQQFFIGGGDTTSWNLLAENRLNRLDFQVYDYLSIRGGINHNQFIHDILWRMSGGLTYNYFQELPDINNLSATLYTSIQKSFKTRTSFIATAAVNYKYYLREVMFADSASSFLQSIKQFNQGGGPGPGQGGPGGGEGGNYEVYVSDYDQRGLGQLLFTLRLAQSLASYTGLAVQYQTRLNFSQYERSVTGLLYGYTSESQIFDDPLGYESHLLGAELTQLLPHRTSVKAAAYYQQKRYVAQGIFFDAINFDPFIPRQDTYRTVWTTVEKRIALWKMDLAVQVNYQWVNNSSNSYWYDYVSQFISLAIQADI